MQTAELHDDLRAMSEFDGLFTPYEILGTLSAMIKFFLGEVICEPPNNRLNTFEGKLTWKNQTFALDNDKMLLRGSILRNTKWCYGVVIFAGKREPLAHHFFFSSTPKLDLKKFLYSRQRLETNDEFGQDEI